MHVLKVTDFGEGSGVVVLSSLPKMTQERLSQQRTESKQPMLQPPTRLQNLPSIWNSTVRNSPTTPWKKPSLYMKCRTDTGNLCGTLDSSKLPPLSLSSVANLTILRKKYWLNWKNSQYKHSHISQRKSRENVIFLYTYREIQVHSSLTSNYRQLLV